MKKIVLGVILGLFCGIILFFGLFFLMPSQKHLSDLQTIGFRLSDKSRFLYFAKYRPDTISEAAFAGVVILDKDLNMLAATNIPLEFIRAKELVIEADKKRNHLQIYAPELHQAIRWSTKTQVFSLCTNTVNDPIEDVHLILKSVQAVN